MECRNNCAACCIYLSISSPIPLHPNGKKAGERCKHLSSEQKCLIYNHPDRPKVCVSFKPDPLMCGSTTEEAKEIMSKLECLNT